MESRVLSDPLAEREKRIEGRIGDTIIRSLKAGRLNPLNILAIVDTSDFFGEKKRLPGIRKRLKQMEKQGLVTHKIEPVSVPPYYVPIGERSAVWARHRRMAVYYPTEKFKESMRGT